MNWCNMPIKKIPPSRKWILGYNRPFLGKMFYKVSSSAPVNIYVMDEENHKISQEGKENFVAITGEIQIMNVFGKITIPPNFKGNNVLIIVENINTFMIDVKLEAGELQQGLDSYSQNISGAL